MLKFSASVDGVEEINRGFNRIDQFISDFRNIWPNVITEFYRIEKEQFDTEGAAGASGKWAPLSPAYKKWKEVHFPGKSILQATGSLYDSLTDPEAFDAILRPEKDELTIGTKIPYAKAHHRGSELQSRDTFGLPQRAIISITEQQKRQIQKAIQRGLVEFTRRAGFQVIEGDKAA